MVAFFGRALQSRSCTFIVMRIKSPQSKQASKRELCPSIKVPTYLPRSNLNSYAHGENETS